MKRYMDLIHKILRYVEANENDDPLSVPDFENYTPAQVQYHIALCYEAGFVNAIEVKVGSRAKYQLRSLTWKGHEELGS